MSAAEKLEGLDTLTLKNEHNVPIRSLTVAEQLVDALPQIVAVVEAAEKLADSTDDEWFYSGGRAETMRTLSALEEALGTS